MTLLLQRHNANESMMQKINIIKVQQGTTYLDKATISSSLQNKLCAEMGWGRVSSALTCDPFKLSSLSCDRAVSPTVFSFIPDCDFKDYNDFS